MRTQALLGRRSLVVGSGVLAVAAVSASLANSPKQALTEWPITALCGIRRSSVTAYEKRLIERRTTRLQARRAAMADADAL